MVVVDRCLGDVPVRPYLAVGAGGRRDGRRFNVGMADRGRISGLLSPVYRFSVGFVMWIGAHRDLVEGPIRVLDGLFVLQQNDEALGPSAGNPLGGIDKC